MGCLDVEEHHKSCTLLGIAGGTGANDVVRVGVVAVLVVPAPGVPSAAVSTRTLPRFEVAPGLSGLHHLVRNALHPLIEGAALSHVNSPAVPGQSARGSAGGVGGAPRRGGGGNAEKMPRCSCGLVLGIEVGPEVVSENKRATVLVASGLFDL
jgi:hypothetical protein